MRHASWHGNFFRITGPLWGDLISHRWITLTKGIDVLVLPEKADKHLKNWSWYIAMIAFVILQNL